MRVWGQGVEFGFKVQRWGHWGVGGSEFRFQGLKGGREVD